MPGVTFGALSHASHQSGLSRPLLSMLCCGAQTRSSLSLTLGLSKQRCDKLGIMSAAWSLSVRA